MDNTEPLRIKLTGTVTITKHGILAASWAIGQLQREMNKMIRTPGAGNIAVD